ncbi:hypothetical protein [Natronorubrum sulfidifaciens]|uniref:Uncharacterized protein n=1 Tax=Natronorubrum sulfidifaciens JCM 14089 TaxID=1230460 RepID=L9WIX9_9EURY|nr:hypothetical protein [Natronorubrum sulfidifaciens]ELY48303.1 hypothetical protein C495_02485 [Natronorubrum sulfidifaciens JCM 14089]
MADTKKGRDKQARDADNRQRERELTEARDRADEAEPPDAEDEGDEAADSLESPRECHRRGCTEPATFLIVERYQEETGHGAVEAEAVLCRAHTAEESPVNLDSAFEDYLFRIEPLSKTEAAATE